MPALRTQRQHSYGAEPYPLPQQAHSLSPLQVLPDGRRGPWAPAEDDLLKSLVQQHGAGNWVAIQNGIKSRSAKQCRERWHQNLDGKLRHDPITPEEGEDINRLVALHGKCWANIARQLKGRSDNAVKNWWNGGENRRKREEARLQQQMAQAHQHTHPHAHPYAAYHPQPYYAPSPTHYQQGLPPSAYPFPQVAGPQLAPLTSPIARGFPQRDFPQLASPLPLSPHHHSGLRRSDLPAPLHISTAPVERSQPSPAGSAVPSLGPSSPRSYGRRDSIQAETPLVQTPITYPSTNMVRVVSQERRSDALSGMDVWYKPEMTEKRLGDHFASLPPIRALISEVPAPRAPRGMEGLMN